MASKDNSPGISFFSFQDIITSITGIMFLVVIILALVAMQQDHTSAARQSDELREELAKLKEDVKQTEARLAELREQDALQKKRIDELKRMRPETLPKIKAQRVKALRDIDDSIRQLENDIARTIRLQEELVEQKKKSESLTAKTRYAIDETRRKIAAMEEENKRREQLYSKLKNVIRFVWQRSSPKRPVLLECSDRQITVNGIDDTVEHRVFSISNYNYKECLDHCRTFPRDTTYFILLIKPSAFYYGEKFSKELKEAGYERGREVLPDEQTLITGEARE